MRQKYRGITAKSSAAKLRIKQQRLAAQLALSEASPVGQEMKLEEPAAVDMAIDVRIEKLDDRTRCKQYIKILCNFRIKQFFI